jgi:nucleoside 2-deoxyribosyltransferase
MRLTDFERFPKQRATRIYVAGPMAKGDREENIRRGIDAGNALVAEGYAVFIPHLNVLWEKHHPKTFEEWLSHDLEWVAACDAVLRLSGESKGADLEVEFCRVRGIPVFSSIADLIASVPKTQPVPQPPAIISHGREM